MPVLPRVYAGLIEPVRRLVIVEPQQNARSEEIVP